MTRRFRCSHETSRSTMGQGQPDGPTRQRRAERPVPRFSAASQDRRPLLNCVELWIVAADGHQGLRSSVAREHLDRLGRQRPWSELVERSIELLGVAARVGRAQEFSATQAKAPGLMIRPDWPIAHDAVSALLKSPRDHLGSQPIEVRRPVPSQSRQLIPRKRTRSRERAEGGPFHLGPEACSAAPTRRSPESISRTSRPRARISFTR